MAGSIGTTSTGGVFIGGTSSGINTTALIEAAVAQKTRRADLLDVEIGENTAKIVAYDELTALTDVIESALDRLRGPDSLFDDTERVWDQKSGTVLTSDGSDFSSILDIAIDSDATPGTYQIEVLEVANAQRVGSNNVTDADAALGFAGSFDLGTFSGSNANISITAGMSLRDVAAAINAETDTSDVEAQIIQVSETEFQLLISGTETAQDLTTFATGGQDVLNLLGVSDGFGGFQNTLQAATGGRIRFDGVEITRNDNALDDVIDGIELNLKNAAPGTIISLEVGNDVIGAKEAIVDFIDSYNAFRDFVFQNQQVDANGNVAENAVLFSDRLLNGLTDEYSQQIGTAFNDGGVIETIRDLGITISNGNRLVLSDEAKLDSALLNNFDDVKNAFAAGAETDNNEFRLTGNTGLTPSQDIVFNITTDGAGTITGVTANGDGSAFTINGRSIEGADGTAFEGLRFTYVGTEANVTINAEFNQGLSERLLSSTSGYTDSVTGLIIQEKANLQTENQEKNQDADEIRVRAEDFRQDQIERYAKLEADISRLNVLLDQIRAILGTDNDD